MSRRAILVTVVIIICFVTFYTIKYNSTINISDSKMIAEKIVNRHPNKYSDVELINIIETQYNKNEYFVLFQYGDDPYSLAIFEEILFFNKKRYKYSGGSSQSSMYGTYKFSQGMEGGHEVLTVVYGNNDFINADHFKLNFPNGSTIVQKIEDKDFMYIYRFYSLNSYNGDLKFYDESGKEI